MEINLPTINSIIVALDGISAKKALNIASKLKNRVWGFKINDLLFEQNMISRLKKYGKVFADAKLHDIPSTVARSTARLEKAGADMLTIHASGGVEMMKAAKMASRRAKILGVTVLTSKNTVNKKGFLKLVADIKKAKLDGIVCSARELKYLKQSKLLKVVPGIRPKCPDFLSGSSRSKKIEDPRFSNRVLLGLNREYNKRDDQKRTATPQEAIKLGADLLIIGRPILKSENPEEAVNKILYDISYKK